MARGATAGLIAIGHINESAPIIFHHHAILMLGRTLSKTTRRFYSAIVPEPCGRLLVVMGGALTR